MTHEEGRGPSDSELVDSYQRNRDAEALDMLVERYLEPTRRLVLGMVLDEADADDLVQETLLNAVRGLPKFDGRSEFSTWLYQIALNTTRRFFRTRKHPSQIGEGDFAQQRGAMAEEPEHKATASEMNKDITAALASLSPQLRAAVVLTVIEKLSVKEVAEIEGCAPETVRWRIHKARKILKQRLAEYLRL